MAEFLLEDKVLAMIALV
jgi:hypothetical protein